MWMPSSIMVFVYVHFESALLLQDRRLIASQVFGAEKGLFPLRTRHTLSRPEYLLPCYCARMCYEHKQPHGDLQHRCHARDPQNSLAINGGSDFNHGYYEPSVWKDERPPSLRMHFQLTDELFRGLPPTRWKLIFFIPLSVASNDMQKKKSERDQSTMAKNTATIFSI